LVDERTRLVEQLHSVLKTYYPLADMLLGARMSQPMAAAFLRRWPELASLQKARPQVLRAFFYKHDSRSSKAIQERLEAVATAKALNTPIRPSSARPVCA
jgi:hypothetical protein